MDRSLILITICLALAACTLPDPPDTTVPTVPAVLLITPAPTLDTDATATVMASALRPSPTPAGLYIVRDGDTLSELAERYAITIEELMAANGLSEPDALHVGQSLIIPTLLPPDQQTSGVLTHTTDVSPTSSSGISATASISASHEPTHTNVFTPVLTP